MAEFNGSIMRAKFGAFRVTYKCAPLDFFDIFKRLIGGDAMFPVKDLGGDPMNGFVKKVEIDGRFFVFKYENKQEDRYENALKSFFRGSHALRLFHKIEKARANGFVACPNMYLVAERYFLGSVRETYILTEYIDGTSLALFPQWVEAESNKNKFRMLIEQMHRFDIVSGDINPGNFIVCADELVAIDLPGKVGTSLQKAEDRIQLEARFGIKNELHDLAYYLIQARMFLRNFLRRLRGKKPKSWKF